MHWTDKYLCPLIQNDKFSWKRVKSVIVDFKELTVHALSFHKRPEEPPKQLPDFKTLDAELVYNVCKEFYDSANDRIDVLEEKSIKLLSYISALFAFISFVFVNIQFVFTKVMLIISLVALVLAIIISFRCVNVKGRKSFFIPDVYSFNSDPPQEHFDKMLISKHLLNASIYNQCIADNTADILRAARYVLTLAIVISMIGFLAGAVGYFNIPTKNATVKVENQVNLNEIESKLDGVNNTLTQINDNFKNINDNKKLQEQVDELTNELKSLKSDYNGLSKQLEEVEKSKSSKK